MKRMFACLLITAFANPIFCMDWQAEPKDPFMEAIEANDIVAVEDFIKKGHKVDFSVWGNGSPEWTPLGRAISWGYYEMTKLLLNAGASVHREFYTTPLFEAARNGHAKITQLLLDRGAKPNENGCSSCSVLYYTIYHSIARDNSFQKYWEYNRTIISLIEAGAELHIALHEAIVWSSIETCKRLIELGADPNQPDENGETAFDWVRKWRHIKRDRIEPLLIKACERNYDSTY
jgi:ankyrin repeat protein